jgi:hypothetical protein
MTLRREFGFWPALGRLRLSDLAAPEVWIGVLGGTLGGILLVRFAERADRIAIAEDYLTLAGALVGVVFAGFALVVGLLSNEYLRWLQTNRDGVKGFLSPFLVSVGLQVGSLILVIVYRAMAPQVSSGWEKGTFIALSALFLLAVLDIVVLAHSVLMHGVARARALAVDDLQAKREATERDRSSGR